MSDATVTNTNLSVGINILVSSLVWGRRITVLNKSICWPPCKYQVFAFVLNILSGWMWWISVHSINGTIGLQLTAGTLATLLSWLSMITIVNDTLFSISRLQLASLAFYLIIDVLNNIQTRLILKD